MKRIGLTQRVEVIQGYGERRDCLDQNWARLLCQLNFVPVPLSNVVQNVPEYVASLDLDGVILTGGNDLADLDGAHNAAEERDRFENHLLDVCSAITIPVLGVCRGMQVINRFFGGQLAPVSEHVATRHRVHSRGMPLPFWNDSFEVNSFHDFAIPAGGIASSLETMAVCEDQTVEALRQKSGAWIGIMWHPERETPTAHRDLETLRWIFEEDHR